MKYLEQRRSILSCDLSIQQLTYFNLQIGHVYFHDSKKWAVTEKEEFLRADWHR